MAAGRGADSPNHRAPVVAPEVPWVVLLRPQAVELVAVCRR